MPHAGSTSDDSSLELGNIMILSFIMISKCHDNRYRREIFSIVISGSTILS